MNCKFDNSLMRDLTHGYGEGRNHICDKCGGHFYDDKWFTRDEWEVYVNETDTEYIYTYGDVFTPARFSLVNRDNLLTENQRSDLISKGWLKRKCTPTETARLRKHSNKEVCLGDIADSFF